MNIPKEEISQEKLLEIVKDVCFRIDNTLTNAKRKYRHLDLHPAQFHASIISSFVMTQVMYMLENADYEKGIEYIDFYFDELKKNVLEVYDFKKSKIVVN